MLSRQANRALGLPDARPGAVAAHAELTRATRKQTRRQLSTVVRATQPSSNAAAVRNALPLSFARAVATLSFRARSTQLDALKAPCFAYLQVEEAAAPGIELSDVQLWADSKRLQTQVHTCCLLQRKPNQLLAADSSNREVF